jgi:hypothetical protein
MSYKIAKLFIGVRNFDGYIFTFWLGTRFKFDVAPERDLSFTAANCDRTEQRPSLSKTRCSNANMQKLISIFDVCQQDENKGREEQKLLTVAERPTGWRFIKMTSQVRLEWA